MSDNNIFELLKSEVQKAIYDLKWKNFRPIQDDAIKSIIQTKDDIIISAPTSAGKTEAAFLPCISESVPEINSSLKIVYISPLKALINDQLTRSEELCKYLNCKVTKWHGDASQSLKKKFLEQPSGVLLITPESLESFLINRASLMKALFGSVDHFIIDEVHSFVGSPRGEQLNSILHRIDSIIEKRPRRILLSATMGSLENYTTWLDHTPPKFIEDKSKDKGIKGSIRYFEYDSKGKSTRIFTELDKITSSGKKLIFGNSKGFLEDNCASLKLLKKHKSSTIDIHHGSLSKDHREHVEKRLKNEDHISVFCTTTLELGIDIGNIEEVCLISPPHSVASFIQRIGRSGRKKDSKTTFSFVMNHFFDEKSSKIYNGLRTDLIQSIAIVELMLEKWCEPGTAQTQSYSTFVHQIMAFVAQKRETTSQELWSEIVQKTFRHKVSKTDFSKIINHLIQNDHLTLTERNSLILGSEGDKLTENYEFYAVFFTPEEWTLRSESKNLGTIPLTNILAEGDPILFSGKNWQVKSVDYEKKNIQVIPSKKGDAPLFLGKGGSIHKKIHQKMKSIYESDESYKYLLSDATKCLSLAQEKYQELLKSNHFLPVFMGSGATDLISFILKDHGYEFINLDSCIYLENKNLEEAIQLLKKYEDEESIKTLIGKAPVEKLFFEKYDEILPPSILRKSFFNSVFDFDSFFSFLDGKYSDFND